MRFWLTLLIAAGAGVAHAAHAAQALLGDVRYESAADHAELEIRLGIAVEIIDLEQPDGDLLRLRLRPAGPGGDAWSATELRFAEADRLLTRVALEGSGRKGYDLLLAFDRPVAAQLLPQFDDHQVLLRVAPRRAHRRLSRSGKPKADDPWVINLESRRDSIPGVEDIPTAFAASHLVYVTDFEQDDVLWHRLRLGFFPDRQAAADVLPELRRYFPDAWLEQVAAGEIRFAEAFRLNPADQVARFEPAPAEAVPEPAQSEQEEVRLKVVPITPSSIGAAPPVPDAPKTLWAERPPVDPPPRAAPEVTPDAATGQPAPEPAVEPAPLPDLTPVPVPAPSAPPAAAAALAADDRPRAEPPAGGLAADARSAFEAENYEQAIRLYTKLLGEAAGTDRQQALEMLGVARELNRQLAHAKRHYELYLEEYPGTAGAARVQQRLAALLVIEQPRRAPLKRPSRKDPSGWRATSLLSQFYRRHSLTVDGNGSVPIDGVFTDVNVIADRHGSALDQSVRVTLSHLLDFTSSERLDGRTFQVSSAYWEGLASRFDASARLGRQSRPRAGVLGRFDGAALTYRPTENASVGMTGGFLVDASFDAPSTRRPFFGLSGEYTSDSGNVSVMPFFVQQHTDGILDRQAVGLQAQLRSRRGSAFSLIDYDVHHAALNNFTLMGNWSFRAGAVGASELSGSYEHRRSPYLTTRNALIGQAYDDLSELEQALLDLELTELARDRTATSDTVRIGFNTRLARRWSITADVVASSFSATESSGDVQALDAHEALYSSFQVRSTDLFGSGSYSAVTLRQADSDGGATTSMFWDNRFELGGRLRIYPRVRVDHRTFDRTGDEQWSTRPSLRVDYRHGRRVRVELEGGYLWTQREMLRREIDMSGFYVRAGYRARF